MKNRRRIKNVPLYSFGANTGNIVEGAAGLLAVLPGLKSSATTNALVVSQSINDVVGGAGAGMKIGSVAGPLGSAIGAGAGAILGSIGKKGGILETQGFTEDNSYTLSTGLTGLFGNKKLKRKIEKDKVKVQGNRIAVANTAELQSDWDYENNFDVNSFALGGSIGDSLAYVDDGELLLTPDGTINAVPEQGLPTDSNLVSLPAGTKILSDRLKVPGTKKTFAEIGEKMMTKRISKGSDRYADNARKLNEMNNSVIHDLLFQMLESMKQSTGMLSAKNAYADGGLTSKLKLKPLNLSGAYDSRRISNQLIPTVGNVEPPMPKLAALNATQSLTQPAKITKLAPATNATTSSKSSIDFGSMASSLASLAPVISNIFSGDAETVRDVQNPYENAALGAMRKRRYNINPTLRAIQENRAVSDYNTNNLNTSTGANMAMRTQSAVDFGKAYQDIYSQASNVLNLYTAEYANALSNAGSLRVAATNLASGINALSRATNRNIRRTGLSQLGGFMLNQQLMKNQKARDTQMMPMYQRFLEAGFTKDDISQFIKGNS